MQDDAWLISAVPRHDAAALRRLAQRHAPVLHRPAYRILADGSEAEDTVPESLLRLWDNAASWKPVGGGVPGWLSRIATDLCLNQIRRSARLSDGPSPEQADPAPGVDARLDRARLGHIMQGAMHALPHRQRVAVVLTYYEQLSSAAAAGSMQINLRAFGSLQRAGRTQLIARVLHRLGRLAERDAGRKVERQRGRWIFALMG